MAASECLSSLSCELRIIRARNVELKPAQDLFVRYYLSAGNNQRIRLNSREISSKSELRWDESFSLKCFGTEDSMDSLKQGSVVFELRYRSTVPVLGRIGGSRLLGRAEMPWKTVLESPEMEIEEWVTMIPTCRAVLEGELKLPAVQVGMKIRVSAMAEPERGRKQVRLRKWDECGCKDAQCHCEDYELLALTAALEAL